MPTFKSNLNYFLALFITGSMLALWLVVPPLAHLFFISGMGTNGFTLANALAIGMVFVLPLLVSKRNGTLLPSATKDGAETRCRSGCMILVISNSIVVLSLLLTVAAYLGNSSYGLVSAFYVAAALTLATAVGLVGIICVETSRLRRPGTPSTLKP